MNTSNEHNIYNNVCDKEHINAVIARTTIYFPGIITARFVINDDNNFIIVISKNVFLTTYHIVSKRLPKFTVRQILFIFFKFCGSKSQNP